MADVAPTSAAVQLDPGRRIAEDVLCSGCEYNLRGLVVEEGAVCPECGLAIARSLRGDLARNADPLWITRVADGTRLIFIGMLVLSVAAAAVQVCAVFRGMHFLDLARSAPGWLAHALTLAALSPVLLGFWKVTTPEPRDNAPAVGARGVARFAVLIAMMVWPLWMWYGSTRGDSVVVVEVLADILLLLGVVAMFIYAHDLARRFPDVRLARHTRWCMNATVLAYACMLVFRPPYKDLIVNLPISNLNAIPRGRGSWYAFRASVELMLSVIGLATFWILILLAWFRHRLREAARVARERI